MGERVSGMLGSRRSSTHASAAALDACTNLIGVVILARHTSACTKLEDLAAGVREDGQAFDGGEVVVGHAQQDR